MARPKQPFSLYKRKRAKTNKIIYYAKFTTSDGEVKVSTGCTSKAAAQNWAINFLSNASEKQKKSKSSKIREKTFREFAKNFWDYEGNYAKGKRARLRTISYGYLDTSKSVTEKSGESP